MTRIVLPALALLVVVAASAQDLSDAQRSAIEDRIKPVGEVCLQGDSSCGGAAATASSGPRSGEEVYNAACMACHTTGAGGALSLQAGSSTGGVGGDVTVETGSSESASSGSITLRSPASTDASSGSITVVSGSGATA